jgi:release factor glutamine methyltransferase
MDQYNVVRLQLRDGGVENADFCARILLKQFPDITQAEDCADAISRLITGEPLSRVLGFAEFYGLDFDLSPDTLDPRQDTETLVDHALSHIENMGDTPLRILDIGTGSGCIIVSVLHEARLKTHTGVATDLSPGALNMARHNAQKHGVADRIDFIQTEWARGIEGMFDLILSNPPYIRRDVIPNLDSNVTKYDPILALDGGEDGLDAYRAILTETKTLLKPGGKILLEIGFDQGESVPRLVAKQGATRTRVHPDLGGNPRVVEISYGDK